MASLIPGYEYDIFISYRQKDNKGERWITEFVNSLKTELESTFKDDVSIYFDENPHDGLLPTHDVDDSLKEKLKCLILIPIVSQTYCDPKSFAWNSEFLAFKKIALGDRFGLKVKISSGNVASRILPVRIHDLDQADTSLLENELSGKVRSVDFIYKSAGVNRPLTPGDNPDKNLNKTFYRDQINKVANAVKEIIQAMENPAGVKLASVTFHRAEKENPEGARKKRKILSVAAVSVLLAALSFYVIFYFVVERSMVHPDKSIAVLPFEDLSQEHDQEYFSSGMTEEIRTHLSKLADLKVISRQSSMKYKGAKISAAEIANELGITNILTGSVRKSGDRVRISVQLIDLKADKDLWSEDYDYRELKDIFAVQTDVSTRVAEILKAKLTQLEKSSLSKTYTDNPQAYKLYLKGRFFWGKRTNKDYDSAESYYKRAIELDPEYALAYSGLADCNTGLARSPQIPIAKDYLMKALSLDSTLSEAWTTVGFIKSHYEYDWTGGKPILEKAIRLNPNYPIAHLYYGNVLLFAGEKNEREKGLNEVRKALDLDPLSISINWALGNRYYLLHKFDLAIEQFQRTLILDPNNVPAKEWMGLSLLHQKLYKQAFDVFNKLPAESNRGLFLSYAFAAAGDKAKARTELEKTLRGKSIRSSIFLAQVYIILGDFDKGMIQLEKEYEIRSLSLISVKTDSFFDPVRKDPRFIAIMKKMNFE